MKKIACLILLTLLTLLSSNSSEAVEVTVLGPVKYIRTSGKTNIFTDSFRAVPKQGILHVRNGDGIGEDQISSGRVQINGVKIFSPKDFNQNVFSLESPVDLLEENSINIEINSKPGSYLEIWVTVDVPLPTATLTLTPQSIIRGETAALSWTTEHAESCTIEPELGEVDLNSSATVAPAETVTYAITCTNLGGNVSESATLTVFQPPTVSLAADPVTIIEGGNSTLTWSSTNADTVSIDNGIGPVGLSGTQSVSPAATTTYTITATGAGGTVSESVMITVIPLPTVSLVADPDTIIEGDSSTLTWNSTNADTVTIDNGIGTVDLSGTQSVSPAATTTYTITATGAGGTVSESVTITVIPLPTVSLSADPVTIIEGGSSTLSWNSTNADTVSIDNGIGTDLNDSVSVEPTEITAGGLSTWFIGDGEGLTVFNTWSNGIDNGIGTVGLSGTQNVSPSATTTYTITATGAGGTVSENVTVTVLPLPTVSSFFAYLPNLPFGYSTRLRWFCRHADTVSIDNGIGTVDDIGTVTVAPTETTTYTITATGAGGTATESVTITVLPLPTVSLSADPLSITAGGSSTLTWSSMNADTVSIDNGIGMVDHSGAITVAPTETTTYTITAAGPSGIDSDTVTVEVVFSGPPSITISATPETIALGTSSQLSWQSNNVANVHIDNGIGSIAATDLLTVTPEHTTIYTITGSSPTGTVSAQVTVEVNGSPEPQPEGSFGTQYEDLIPEDATVDEYDEKRFSLITGTVNDMAESPLADVRITVHGHPEYGTVLTDTEGRFTIPVDGGGTITIAYEHAGFITSHRQVYVPWNDIAIAETIQMPTEDSAATQVTFDGNPETVVTHTSSLISDESAPGPQLWFFKATTRRI